MGAGRSGAGKVPPIQNPPEEPEEPTSEDATGDKDIDSAESDYDLEDALKKHGVNATVVLAPGKSVMGNPAVDIAVARQAVKAIADLADEFPQASESFSSLMLWTDKRERKRAYAGCAGDYIVVNPDKMGDLATLKSKYENDVKAGFHPQGTSWKDVIAHEYGHHLEQALIDKEIAARGETGLMAASLSSRMWNRHDAAKRVIDEAYNNYKASLPKGTKIGKTAAYKAVSEYASENRAETLAECVADYRANGSKANGLSIEVWKILKRELG